MTVTLVNCDCLEYMRTMPAGSVDAVITDPPYGIDKTEWDDKQHLNSISEIWRISRSYCVVFYANTRLYELLNLFVSLGAETWTIAWLKSNAMQISRKFLPQWSPIVVAYRRTSHFWGQDYCKYPIVSQHVGHPTPKMPNLMRWLIKKASKSGDTVFDPFMGSGTTGVACVQLGRSFIGCEIDPGYFAIAEKRIKQAQLQMLLPLEL